MTEFVADAEKLNQLEGVLSVVSDSIGDITSPVLDSFFTRYPGAKEVFQKYPSSRRNQLQNEMVETAVYCLLTWYERPMEIQILLSFSVPHHQDLNIPVDYFTGLMEVVLEVIANALPAGDTEQTRFVQDLRQQLLKAIDDASQ